MARSKVRLKWRNGAFREVRTTPEIVGEIVGRAEAAADFAGDGYVVQSGVTGGRGRARAAVITATPRAMVDNAKRHTLIRSIDAAKG